MHSNNRNTLHQHWGLIEAEWLVCSIALVGMYGLLDAGSNYGSAATGSAIDLEVAGSSLVVFHSLLLLYYV